MNVTMLELKKMVGGGLNIEASIILTASKDWYIQLGSDHLCINLNTQRGAPRAFKTLDTAAYMLKTVGIEKFSVFTQDRFECNGACDEFCGENCSGKS